MEIFPGLMHIIKLFAQITVHGQSPDLFWQSRALMWGHRDDNSVLGSQCCILYSTSMLLWSPVAESPSLAMEIERQYQDLDSIMTLEEAALTRPCWRAYHFRLGMASISHCAISHDIPRCGVAGPGSLAVSPISVDTPLFVIDDVPNVASW